MKKDKKNSFNTPEGYFDSFNDRLMDRIHKEEAGETKSLIPETDGFVVPDHYFDTIAPTVLSKVDKKETKIISFRPKQRFNYSVAAIAAVFLLVFSLTWKTKEDTLNFDDLANSELDAYFEYINIDITSYEIAETTAMNDIELSDILDISIEDNSIIEYLDSNIEDIEDLNLDYTDYEQ